MFQRDYMMRMIEQVGAGFAQVMGLRRRKEHVEALQVIDELLDRHFRLNSRLIHSLSTKDLVDMMTVNGVTDTTSLQTIALLLKEQGAIEAERGQDRESYARSLKSLDLFLRLAVMNADNKAADPSLEAAELLDHLKGFELPAETKELVFRWHEDEGRYDEAENWLYELVEDKQTDRATAADFYRRLLLLSDEQLLAGGLSREEAETGLAGVNEQGVQ